MILVGMSGCVVLRMSMMLMLLGRVRRVWVIELRWALLLVMMTRLVLFMILLSRLWILLMPLIGVVMVIRLIVWVAVSVWIVRVRTGELFRRCSVPGALGFRCLFWLVVGMTVVACVRTLELL